LNLIPRDKKKFYFADTAQRRALIVIASMLFAQFMKMDEIPLALTHLLMFTLTQTLLEARRGVYSKVPQSFEQN